MFIIQRSNIILITLLFYLMSIYMILNRILKIANFEPSSHKIWPELTRITHMIYLILLYIFQYYMVLFLLFKFKKYWI
jgi:hypothetical protein